MNEEQRQAHFAHAHDDLNLRISRMYEGAFWLDTVQIYDTTTRCLTHLCRMDFHTTALWTGPLSKEGCLITFIKPCFREIYVFNANLLDPDQTPRSAASDLGLHCLPMSLLWDARHK